MGTSCPLGISRGCPARKNYLFGREKKGTAICLFLDGKNKKFKLRKSLYIVVSSCCSFDRSGQKKRKPYQHDSEAMELVLRFLDRKQGAVNREYWGECFSATLLQSVGEKRDKKENKMITSYNCQAITVSFLRTKKRDACAKWLF